MGEWENKSKSDEWYTPKYIFDAMDSRFDLDVAHPKNKETFSTSDNFIYEDSLNKSWAGFVWMNSPFEGRNGLIPWLDKFFNHKNGVCLTPDRTSTAWWQDAYTRSDAILFVHGKIKFMKPDGTYGKSPANGTTLFAVGKKGVEALINAEKYGLGVLVIKS